MEIIALLCWVIFNVAPVVSVLAGQRSVELAAGVQSLGCFSVFFPFLFSCILHFESFPIQLFQLISLSLVGGGVGGKWWGATGRWLIMITI